MKSLMIALSLSVLGPSDSLPKVDAIFACRACKKEFEKCATCGVPASHHGMVDHDPDCTCGGKADFK